MATNNRSINICLINTLKPTEDLPDNNRIGIDHVNSFIWFDSKKDRDDYFALKTVHSQTQNSKIHDFNAVGTFRIALDMESYYKLDADLLKVNHTQNGIENVYIYNITDVDYTNNGVVEVAVEMNVIYTYLLDDVNERNQLQGVVSKSNFKNENVTIGDINNIAKGLIGDSYGAVNYDSNSRKVVDPSTESSELKHKVSWVVISLRKKPNLIDDAAGGSLLDRKIALNTFSDEIILFSPLDNITGNILPLRDSDGNIYESSDDKSQHINASDIGYLVLNGSLNISDRKTGFIGALVDAYAYVTDMPFTFSSFFDVQEMGILPDPPLSYEVKEEGTSYIPKITSPNSKEQIIKIGLRNNIKNQNYTFYCAGVSAIEINNNEPGALQLSKYPIMSNNEKLTKLFNGFENLENNIIYNRYYLKFYNTMSEINSYNLFGSNQPINISTIYLGTSYKKLFLSTDTYLEGLSLKDQFNGVGNSDFVIKFNGNPETGSDLSQTASNTLMGALDVIGPIAGGILGTVIAPGVGTVAGIAGSTLLGGASHAATSTISGVQNNFNQRNGVSGYVNSNEFQASNFFSAMQEYKPKIIFERSGNTSQIDQQTNYFGTSCSIFTNNLKTYIKDIINNRKNHKCFVQGDFRPNRLYPQANEAIRAKLGQGIMLMIKISMQVELEWYRKNKSKGVE